MFILFVKHWWKEKGMATCSHLSPYDVYEMYVQGLVKHEEKTNSALHLQIYENF